jgi:hypothetical protein
MALPASSGYFFQDLGCANYLWFIIRLLRRRQALPRHFTTRPSSRPQESAVVLDYQSYPAGASLVFLAVAADLRDSRADSARI